MRLLPFQKAEDQARSYEAMLLVECTAKQLAQLGNFLPQRTSEGLRHSIEAPPSSAGPDEHGMTLPQRVSQR